MEALSEIVYCPALLEAFPPVNVKRLAANEFMLLKERENREVEDWTFEDGNASARLDAEDGYIMDRLCGAGASKVSSRCLEQVEEPSGLEEEQRHKVLSRRRQHRAGHCWCCYLRTVRELDSLDYAYLVRTTYGHVQETKTTYYNMWSTREHCRWSRYKN